MSHDARRWEKPCSICRHWFRPDPRVGVRQRACGHPECQAARRRKTQAAWRARNPDYCIARRIQARRARERPPAPLRLPPPLSLLPWVLSTLLLQAAQDQFRAYSADSAAVPGTLPPPVGQDQRPPAPDLSWSRPELSRRPGADRENLRVNPGRPRAECDGPPDRNSELFPTATAQRAPILACCLRRRRFAQLTAPG